MTIKKLACIVGFCLCFAVPTQAQQMPSEQKALIALTHQGFSVKQMKSGYQNGKAVLLVHATRQGKRYELILSLPSLRVIEQKIQR